MLAILSSSVCHSPSPSYNPSMLFFLLHWLILWWKNFVFLSPTGNHMDLDLCLQNTSSWCKSSFISLFAPCILSTFCPYPSSINVVSFPCFASMRVLVFLNVTWLQAMRFILHFFFLKKAKHRATMRLYLVPWLLDYPFTIGVSHPFLFKPLDFVLSSPRLNGWCHVQHNRVVIRIGYWKVTQFCSREDLTSFRCRNYPI